MPKVAIIMGSRSDLPVLEKTIRILKDFYVEVDVQVMSAHRTPEKVSKYAQEAEINGIEVIIAAAGKAAHLPGVIAAYTCLPVIGLPVKSSTMDGLDSLLSIVQMPSGVPVATVAINGSDNAAILAIQILALRYKELSRKLQDYKKEMAEQIDQHNLSVQREVREL